MAYLALILAFVANAVANVLLKVGADRGLSLDFSQGLGKLLLANAYLIGGVALFAVNVVFYVIALRSLPLTLAYPVMVGMSFLIASSLAVFYLHESLGWPHLLGYLLILLGATLIVFHGN